MADVAMPRLSDSMQEGTVLAWLRGTGDHVASGDELVEIETDKATMIYVAESDGFLRIVANEGDTVPVGATIACLVAERADALDEPPPGSRITHRGSDQGVGASVTEGGATPPAVTWSRATSDAAVSSVRLNASPIARRIARDQGIDLAAVEGTGPGGRIVKADVESLAARMPVHARTEPDWRRVKGAVRIVALTRRQRTIAQRMTDARAMIPEFTATIAANAEPAFALRDQPRELTDPLPSLNDIVIRACAIALRRHPRVNAAYVDDHFEEYERINIGIAVARKDHDLFVPTVFDADTKSITDIATETRALSRRVHEATITPRELEGATFTVSNLGMFGVGRFTAVISPPQAAILAVGAASWAIVAGPNRAPIARRIMELTLSADHRILYGADAAAFLDTTRKLLEGPIELGRDA